MDLIVHRPLQNRFHAYRMDTKVKSRFQSQKAGELDSSSRIVWRSLDALHDGLHGLLHGLDCASSSPKQFPRISDMSDRMDTKVKSRFQSQKAGELNSSLGLVGCPLDALHDSLHGLLHGLDCSSSSAKQFPPMSDISTQIDTKVKSRFQA
jgi:hypothetical protein